MMRPYPPPSVLVEATEALLVGDPKPCRDALREIEAWSFALVHRAWWEISTLCGCVADTPQIAQANQSYVMRFGASYFHMTGGPPRTLANGPALARAWSQLVAERPTRALHRRNMADAFAQLRANTHEDLDAAYCLLCHHTDRPLELFDERQMVFLDSAYDGAKAAAHLSELVDILATDEAFDAHVNASLSATSIPRRDLAWRLARLPPALVADDHEL